MNFGGLLENLDPALLQQIMASIQPASDPRLQITVPANQHETNMPQQWPPPNAQQAFSGMPEQAQVGILNQPRPQMPQPQMPQPQQAEQRPRAEALPEPKPEYTPPTPGILGKPMPATLPKDPYEFDFKKNWPMLLLQFANGMGQGNRKKGNIFGPLAAGATGAGNYLQQYPQQKMQEALLKGKVDEVTQKTNVQAAFNEYLNNPNITPEQKRMAQFLGPEKWAEKNMAATPSGFNRDEKGNLSVDPGYAQYNFMKSRLSAPNVNTNLTVPQPLTDTGKTMGDLEKTNTALARKDLDPQTRAALENTKAGLQRQLDQTGWDQKDVATLRKNEATISSNMGHIQNYIDMINTHGSQLIPGEKRAELQASYGMAMGAIRALLDMGVLQPGELPLIKSIIADPTTAKGAVLELLGGKEAFNAQAQQVMKGLERNRQAYRSAYTPQSTPQDVIRAQQPNKVIKYDAQGNRTQ